MASGDGNGWVDCSCGHRHWGRHGAAGLLLVRPDARRGQGFEALLQLRAAWTDQGGTWGLPGGAADSHEDAAAAALREAWEEAAVDPDAVDVLGDVVATDHGTWRYTVVVGRPIGPVRPRVANAESDEVRWVTPDEAAALPLLGALAATWDLLVQAVRTLSAA